MRGCTHTPGQQQVKDAGKQFQQDKKQVLQNLYDEPGLTSRNIPPDSIKASDGV